MPEILDEFEQVVDLIRNKDRYAAMGAKLPGGVLLNGPPGTGKTLIAKAIAGEAGVPFLYASGSQFDEMYVGVGASRMRKLFKEAREQSPCIIFIDEIDAVAGKRNTSGEGSPSYARMTINQLLQEMDGLKENENIIVLAATNLKGVIDPALLRPGRFDLIIDVPTPDKKGREEILEHYFSKVKHDSTINIKRIADVTAGFTGASLANIVNQAAIKAVNEGHKKVDLSHLEFAFDKITMGPELKSMKQNLAGETKTAIHEGGHCLIAYLLHKNGEYALRPRKATVTRRGGALGHVSFMSDDKSDESSQSLQHLRAHLVVGMGGRAAEAIFHGETKVCTGAASDMQQAFKIAQSIVCQASAGDQVKGRMIDLNSASETKKAEVDKLIDAEIDIAYKRAIYLLKKESKLHQMLIEAMIKFKTLDADEIELLLTKKSLKAVQLMREENEKIRKTEIEKKSSILEKIVNSGPTTKPGPVEK
jgi:ATP-dependent metalloprotease